MKLDPPLPVQFDLSKIEFPTDRVTIGELRKRQPKLFNFLVHHSDNLDLIHITAAMTLEQELAFKAFARAARMPDPDPDPLTRPSELIRMLDRDYRRQVISTGYQQTKQMVRAFEKAAAEQGRSIRGHSR